jgi:hypothetical protein
VTSVPAAITDELERRRARDLDIVVIFGARFVATRLVYLCQGCEDGLDIAWQIGDHEELVALRGPDAVCLWAVQRLDGRSRAWRSAEGRRCADRRTPPLPWSARS